MNTPPSIQLELSLLLRMFQGDLDIAKRMTEIGDFAMAIDALENAKTKLSQIAALWDSQRAPALAGSSSVNPDSTIDV